MSGTGFDELKSELEKKVRQIVSAHNELLNKPTVTKDFSKFNLRSDLEKELQQGDILNNVCISIHRTLESESTKKFLNKIQKSSCLKVSEDIQRHGQVIHEVNDPVVSNVKDKLEKYCLTNSTQALKRKHWKQVNAEYCAKVGCSNRASTTKHISWCREHEKELLFPMKKDFDNYISTNKLFLHVEDLESQIKSMKDGEVHEALYKIAIPFLERIVSNSTEMADSCKELLSAITTYKEMFNPLPEICKFLLQMFTVASTTPVLAGVCGVMVVVVIVLVMSFNVREQNKIPSISANEQQHANNQSRIDQQDRRGVYMVYGSLIGAGLGTFLGPPGSFAGSLIGGALGGMLSEK